MMTYENKKFDINSTVFIRESDITKYNAGECRKPVIEENKYGRFIMTHVIGIDYDGHNCVDKVYVFGYAYGLPPCVILTEPKCSQLSTFLRDNSELILR